MNWSELYFTGIAAYGAPALALALFICAAGLPLPGTLFVVSAGALAQQGLLDGAAAAGLGLTGLVLGDSLGYGLGRFAGAWALPRLGGSEVWRRAGGEFQRRGGWFIYLTRFLITPLAVPVNVLAGSNGCSYWRFLRSDAAGELTWLALYGGAGYLAGAQWEAVAGWAEQLGAPLAAVLLAGGVIWCAWRIKRRRVGEPSRACLTESAGCAA